MPLSVVILAAGQGKRMLSDHPKVLQPLAGEPLLAHVVAMARQLKPQSIHIVYGHGGEKVQRHFAEAGLEWALQAEQLGTGHALKQALPAIPVGNRVLVLYGDVPLLRAQTVQALLACAAGSGLALLTAKLADPSGYGRIVRDARGSLRKIVEERDTSVRERGIDEVNTGVMVAPCAQLRQWLPNLSPRNAQGEYYLTDVIAMAVARRQKIATLSVADATEVLGVNDREQLAAAESEHRRRRARELMAQGATLIDPTRIDVRGEVRVGRDVVIDVNVVLEGQVRLEDGVRVGPNCVIRDALIGARTVLQANCLVQQAELGSDCQVGPFTRVRPQTRLAAGVHLGNFVEIKNAQIGAGSKVNHLSYIGDATVGANVNVGAGTITCNYDGANKWRTTIGANVFVGSGSMLVAPVKIGDGATLGAGTTLTSDAPPGKLTLARARQTTVENWQRPRKPAKS